MSEESETIKLKYPASFCSSALAAGVSPSLKSRSGGYFEVTAIATGTNGLPASAVLFPPKEFIDLQSEKNLVSVESAGRVSKSTKQRHLISAEGGYIAAEEAAKLMQMGTEEIDLLRIKKNLIGILTTQKGYVYPVWQFEPAVREGLTRVLAILTHLDPWMQLAFMLSSNIRLSGKTPLAALRLGLISEVERAAYVHGEHGAS